MSLFGIEVLGSRRPYRVCVAAFNCRRTFQVWLFYRKSEHDSCFRSQAFEISQVASSGDEDRSFSSLHAIGVFCRRGSCLIGSGQEGIPSRLSN